MSKKFLIVLVLLLSIAAATGTAVLFLYPYEPSNPPEADDTGSTEEGIIEVVNTNNQFAFELYSDLSKSETENIFFSPYSISSALAMVYEGARAETAEEIKSVFHFPDYSKLRSNFAAIYNGINSGNQDYELRTGNALWVQQDYPVLKNYTEVIERYYGGKATNVDFIKETEKSRQTINSFIEEQTNGKIKELIPEGFLDSMTRLVITNAIYFKGTWKWQFDPKDTKDRDFKITPTNVVKVPMMYMKPEKAMFNYAHLEDLQILELPYKGENVSMLIILPEKDLNSIHLTAENLEKWKSEMKKTKIESIYLPKFEFDTKYLLNENLKTLGMPTAFTPSADFSGISGKKDLFIDFVIHKAYVKVDEEGTEAAAATGVGMKLTAMPESIVFRADHPFLFIIQQKDTGNILFMGRVVNPAE